MSMDTLWWNIHLLTHLYLFNISPDGNSNNNNKRPHRHHREMYCNTL